MSVPDILLAHARAWLALDPDPATHAELTALLAAADTAALAERFAGRLAFGTAGIRGVMGAGPMRMNRVVVRQVSAGLADHLLSAVPDAARRGVVIGYDARHGSRQFAEDAARVLAGRGLRVFLADRPWPTPVTAFAVLERGAAGGVMVTASHNPPEYNGYKVYWGNGAQIIEPIDSAIAAAIARVADASAADAAAAPAMPELATIRAAGLLVELGEPTLAAYLAGVRALSVEPDTIAPHPITIAYTPLHGVGAESVTRALTQAGFHRVHFEPSQRAPDGDFPTVAFPNPEEPGAMDRVLALAARVGADLVLANDPDADRLAVALPDPAAGVGRYRMLSGDQVGILLADYLLEHHRDGRRLVATTIVSSQLLSRMAEAAGADYRETLTGFKWIANAAIDWAGAGGGRFILGYEEALGYSVGELVRDKDGVSAAVLFAELTAAAAARGELVADRLDAIYRRHGLYLTEQASLTLPGSAGLQRIEALMARFRAAPPTEVAGHAVVAASDLAAGAGDLPRSDVLIYRLAGDRRIVMRPSGTEPKLKSYYEVRVPVGAKEPMADAITRARAELKTLRAAHQALLG